MAKVEAWYEQDLKRPVRINYLDGSFFNQDAAGSRIGVKVYSDGQAVTLAGSITGYCVQADGTTVPISGTRSGNTAYIDIPQSALSVPGPLTVTIKNTESSVITTLCAVVGIVTQSRTGVQVDPGQTVTDWTNQISAQLQACQTAADNVGAIVAVPYASLTFPVEVNTYTTYNGNLYCCTTRIATSESFTAAHWRQTNVCSEISDLKSALNIQETFQTAGEYTYSNVALTAGKAIARGDGLYVTAVDNRFAATEEFIYIPIGTTSIESNTVANASGTYGIAFYDESKTFISGSGVANFAGVTILSTYRYVRITDFDANSSFSDTYIKMIGEGLNKKVDKTTYNEKISELESTIDIIGEDSLKFTGVHFTAGGGINSNGTVTGIAGSTWAYSDYIPVPGIALTIESNAISESSSYGLAFYDEDKNFISGSFNSNYNSPNIAVLPTYKFVRLTNYNANSTHTGINVTFTNKEAWMKKIIPLACDGEYKYSGVGFTTNSAINSIGNVAGVGGATTWASSGFIEVPKYSTVMKTNAISASSTLGLAFYDATKTFISGSFLANYNSPTVQIEDTYKYVRITNYNASSTHTGIFVTFESSNSLSRNGIYKETNKNLADVINNASILSGTYTLNSVITLAENQIITGQNCVVTVADGGQIKMSKGSCISGIKFVGSWNPTRVDGDGTTYTEYGYVPLISYQDLYDGDTDALYGENKTYDDAVIYIIATSSQNVRVDGCIFENLDRLAIFASGRRHKDKDNPVVCNCYFSDCRMCIYVHGEFERIYSNEYFRCVIGCTIIGANCNNFGEIFKCCDVAYYFPGSNNPAHGEITGCEMAHCGLAGVYINTITDFFGHIINGCHIVDSPVKGYDVNCLLINGCRLDTWFEYSSGSKNSIICSIVRKGYLYGHTHIYSVPSDTLVAMNKGMRGTTDDEANNQ